MMTWLRQQPRWFAIALVAGLAIVVVGSGAVATVAITADPADAPSATPSPSTSTVSSPTPHASSPTASPSPSPPASPSPSATAEAWVPWFPIPGVNDARHTEIVSAPILDAMLSEPIYSPDGVRAAFTYQGVDDTRIYAGELDGSRLVSLPQVAPRYIVFPAWSPDGSRVAYITTTVDGPAVATVRADGTDRDVLATLDLHPDEGCCVKEASLSWSADGRRVAVTYGSSFDELEAVRFMLVDVTSGSVELHDGAGAAQFSPASGALAYIAPGTDGAPALWMSSGGSDRMVTSVARGQRGSWVEPVVWSPDGAHLAYRSGVDEGAHWRVIGADGRGGRALTEPGETASIVWSPDASRVLVTADRRGVFAIDVDGGADITVWSGRTETRASWASESLVVYAEGSTLAATDLSTGDRVVGSRLIVDSSIQHEYFAAPTGVGLEVFRNLRGTENATITVVVAQ